MRASRDVLIYELGMCIEAGLDKTDPSLIRQISKEYNWDESDIRDIWNIVDSHHEEFFEHIIQTKRDD